MTKRKVCIVTGTRAEYGLLRPLMTEIAADSSLCLQVVATGMHLAPEFGLTYRYIEQDGFAIAERVEMLVSSDTSVGLTKSMGLGLIGFADALARLQPDIMVVLGDRFETFVAAQAAMAARLPLAHIHGGEITAGAMDDAIRHAITKLAHVHFVSAQPHRQRVIQLGEQPNRVFDVGAIGIDNIVQLPLMSKSEFETAIGFSLGPQSFLITYHPATLDTRGPTEAMNALFAALDTFPNARIIWTKPNADTGSKVISDMVDAYQARYPARVSVHVSMGQLRYLNALQHVDVVIGNSSSGIIEAPVFKKPTVNVGDRQRGRLKASSIIDCAETADAIAAGIRRALSDAFRAVLTQTVSLYGSGTAAVQIKDILQGLALEHLLHKEFYDWPTMPV